MLQESYLCCGLMGRDLHFSGQYGSQEFPKSQERVAPGEGELELEGCEGPLLSPKVNGGGRLEAVVIVSDSYICSQVLY